MHTKGILNAFQMKLLLVALMLLDHLYLYLPGMPDWFTWLGRLVAPVFTYLMVESYRHTSDKIRYIKRLTAAGLVMMAGNTLLTYIFGNTLSQNIFLSLAVSAGLLFYLDRFAQYMNRSHAFGIVCMFFLSFFCEGAIICPVMAVIFYYMRGNPPVMLLSFAGASVLLSLLLMPSLFPQVLMVGAALLLPLYNGRRGPGGAFAKWFFYVVYPVHIWILYAVNQLYFKA